LRNFAKTNAVTPAISPTTMAATMTRWRNSAHSGNPPPAGFARDAGAEKLVTPVGLVLGLALLFQQPEIRATVDRETMSRGDTVVLTIRVAARGNEPAHQHLDLRYLVWAPEGARVSPALAELHEIRWVAWDETDALDPDHGLRRALAKAQRLV